MHLKQTQRQTNNKYKYKRTLGDLVIRYCRRHRLLSKELAGKAVQPNGKSNPGTLCCPASHPRVHVVSGMDHDAEHVLGTLPLPDDYGPSDPPSGLPAGRRP
eukprot:8405890-Heterocapsa_arctica.AAC.1